MEVAVKALKPDAPEDEEVKFLQEAAIMGQFYHSNIVKLHGVVTLGKPVSEHVSDKNTLYFTFLYH